MLNSSEFRRAILGIDTLGSAPAILAKVSAMAKDPDADLNSICDLVRDDGALTADIIRISNSPYYAPATLHSNLTSAIGQIGLREVVRVVGLSVSRQILAQDLTSYGIGAHEYWTRSLSAAVVMEALASGSDLSLDDAYTIGLLHAIGRVLINRVITEKGFSIFWEWSQPIQQWERESVGFDYAEAGAILLRHWHFPVEMCDTIRCQLEPLQAEGPVSLGGALKLTLSILELAGPALKEAGWSVQEDHPGLRAFGFTPDTIQTFTSECREKLEEIHSSLELED